jgi:hypothetical protein
MNTIDKLKENTEDRLKKKTKKFLKLYWPKKQNEIAPEWGPQWFFNGTIPSHDKQGCYALLINDKIVYIGSAISKGTEPYQNHGLGYRLKNYFKVNKNLVQNKNQYTQTEDWQDVTGIVTIGFPEGHFWLAAALEIYLIKEMKGLRNKNFKQ